MVCHGSCATSLAIAWLSLPALRSETPLRSRDVNLRQSEAVALAFGRNRAQAKWPLYSTLRQLQERRRLRGGSPVYKVFEVSILYEVKPDSTVSSIFDVRALKEIARFERRLRAHPEWRALCNMAAPESASACSRGLSFANYALAEVARPPSKVRLTGEGAEPLPPEASVHLAEKHGLKGFFLPLSAHHGNYSGVRTLRSLFKFRFLCCTSEDPEDYIAPVMEQLSEDWGIFRTGSLLPTIESQLEQHTVVDVAIYGSGTGRGLDTCAASDPLLPDAEVLDSSHENLPADENVCSEEGFHNLGSRGCALLWCKAVEPPQNAAGGCSCFRRESQACGDSDDTARVSVGVVGPRHISRSQLSGRIASVFNAEGQGLRFQGGLNASWSSSWLSQPVVLEGQAGTQTGFVTEASAVLQRPSPASSCGWSDLCFCGVNACQLPAIWSPIQPLPLGQIEHVNNSAPQEHKEYVHVIWGLLDNDMRGFDVLLEHRDPAVQRLSFANLFDPLPPQAQRDFYSFCQSMPEDLLILKKLCWIEDFRDWLKNHHERFPVPAPGFHQKALEFSSNGTNGTSNGSDFMLPVDGAVRAFFATFEVDIRSECTTGHDTWVYKDKWDRHVNGWNARAFSTARGAWHTSRIWRRARAPPKPRKPKENYVHTGSARASLGRTAAIRACLLGLLGAASPLLRQK